MHSPIPCCPSTNVYGSVHFCFGGRMCRSCSLTTFLGPRFGRYYGNEPAKRGFGVEETIIGESSDHSPPLTRGYSFRCPERCF